jgi:antitoxin VapB
VTVVATVSIFENRSNQAIRIPALMRYEGVSRLEIRRDGDVITLRPARPTWQSFADLVPRADADFLADRPTVVPASRMVFNEDDE